MANGLPPPARIPSSEAIRKAALARSAKRGARVAAWRLGFRWFLWGSGKALLGLSAVAAVALVFMGLRWGWLAAQARWADPLPLPSSPAPAPAPVAPPAAAPDPRRSFPLRLDESEPTTAPKRAAAGAQSSAPRNTEAQRP